MTISVDDAGQDENGKHFNGNERSHSTFGGIRSYCALPSQGYLWCSLNFLSDQDILGFPKYYPGNFEEMLRWNPQCVKIHRKGSDDDEDEAILYLTQCAMQMVKSAFNLPILSKYHANCFWWQLINDFGGDAELFPLMMVRSQSLSLYWKPEDIYVVAG